MDERTTQSYSKGKALTPLWVISLFISLTETVLTIGVMRTAGGIQLVLTMFVLIFPILIAGTFFLILWNRPWVLYAPGEFGTGTNVKDFVREISDRPRSAEDFQLYPQIQQSIRDALTSPQVITELSKITIHKGNTAQEEVKSILSDAAADAEEKIRNQAFLTINTHPFDGISGRILEIPYGRYDNISSFLDKIYITLRKKVPPYTFGQTWALRESSTGRLFSDLGSLWARQNNYIADKRTLSQVGIKAGMNLEVIPVMSVLKD